MTESEVERIVRLVQNPRRTPEETAEVRAFLDRDAQWETTLGGPGYPPEVLEQHPELGHWDFTPNTVRWMEVPGMVQMLVGTFIPDKGWLVTKRGIMYGGHHGPPPLIEDDVDRVMSILTHELRAAIRAMQHRLEQEP